MGGAKRRIKGNDRIASESSMRSFTLPKSENLNFLSNNAFSKFLSLSRWVLMLVKLPYSKTRKKLILLRCSIFKEFIFLKKIVEMGYLFAQPNCENKSFKPDHQISSKCPIQRFSNSDHQFCFTLKSKGR